MDEHKQKQTDRTEIESSTIQRQHGPQKPGRKGALIAVGAALIVLFISMLAAAGTFSYLTYSEPDTIKAIL
jgi:hypothetical protein